MPRVMISYRNIPKQKEFAVWLDESLRNAGIETWMDIKDIPPLALWEKEIFNGIINSDYVALCLSPEYLESETCLFECYIARGYRKNLLPLLVAYTDLKDFLELLNEHEETQGLNNLNFINFVSQSLNGLIEPDSARLERIVNTIQRPIPEDKEYLVYISYRASYAKFASEIADGLNQAGISTFIATRSIDVGVDWRRVSWDAIVRAKYHIVVLSPDIVDSTFIKNEILVSRTKEPVFIPILYHQFNSDEMIVQLRDSFSTSANLDLLNKIQWFKSHEDTEKLIQELAELIGQLENASP